MVTFIGEWTCSLILLLVIQNSKKIYTNFLLKFWSSVKFLPFNTNCCYDSFLSRFEPGCECGECRLCISQCHRRLMSGKKSVDVTCWAYNHFKKLGFKSIKGCSKPFSKVPNLNSKGSHRKTLGSKYVEIKRFKIT